MLKYIAIVHKEPDSDYGVSFPDFPGCITAGATLDEACDMAREALGLHIRGLQEDGETLPDARTMDKVKAQDDAYSDTVQAFLVVEVSPLKKEPVRINATFDPDLLAAIDKAAKAQGTTRSGFLARAAEEALH